MGDCQVCGITHPDTRTLRIGHGYDLSEVSRKFERIEIAECTKGETIISTVPAWTVVTCKDCRGDLMTLLRQWFRDGPSRRLERELDDAMIDAERNIPVRVDGRTVMMTYPEWQQYREERGDTLPG